MGVYLDYKMNIWGRMTFPESVTKEQVLAEIAAGKTPNEVYETFAELEPTFEYLDEAEKIVDPKDNDGHATVELYEDDGNLIYANGKTFKDPF